jgi:hypothetical protein
MTPAWPGPGYVEPRQFEPEPGLLWGRILQIALIIATVFWIGFWAIVSYPPDPPPHESKYVAHESQPLGPAPIMPEEGYIDPSLEYAFKGGSTVEFLYGIHIDTVKAMDGSDEIAIYVSGDWDCVLAVEGKGCIIK